MKTLVVLVAVWKRHELARKMLEHTLEQAARVKERGTVLVHVVVSDAEDPEARAAIEDLPVTISSAPNSPLSDKWNSGLEWALNCHQKADGVMILGSDDFATAPIFEQAILALEDDVDVFGLSDFFFVGPGPRAAYWPGYAPQTGRQGEPMGAGRTFSRELIEFTHRKLWPSGLEKGLDGACWKLISEIVGNVRTMPVMATGGMIVDVKAGDEQMSAFERYIETGEEVDWRRVLEHYPVMFAESLGLDPMPSLRWRLDVAEPKLGLVMIAKNAEATIERAIRMAAPVIDSAIVVLDSSTTDQTHQILDNMGIDVHVSNWPGFGKQRNLAASLSRARWHLILDADETFEPGDILDAIKEAEEQDADAISCTVITTQKNGQAVLLQPRVQRAGRTKWVYRCHNDVLGVKKAVASTATFRQDYRGVGENRAARAIPVLTDMYYNPSETDVTPEQERLHAANFLSQAYFGVGDWANVRTWAQITVAMDKEGKYPEAECRAVLGMLQAGDFDGARKQLNEALVRHPDFGDLHHLAASVSLARWFMCIASPGRYATRPQLTGSFTRNYHAAVKALGLPIEAGIRYEEQT